MSAQQLFDSFKNYLHVTTNVPSWSYNGDALEVPEDFKLKVTVWNTAPRGTNLGDHPYITFRNVRVMVEATEFATPVDDNGVGIPLITVPLGDPTLTRDDNGVAYINMRAVEALPFLGWPGMEKIAVVTVIADVDASGFFRINKPQDAFHDILPD